MSSHREAPETSKDPVADNTDVYAFVSPDSPDTVTIISNYIPFEGPAGGPSFYEFGEDVLYSIYIDNNGDAKPDITYTFTFQTRVRHQESFLYNTGPINSISDPNWNRPQVYSVYRQNGNGRTRVIGQNLASPPCNIGPRSTPNYASLASLAVHTLNSGETVFAGQRQEGFYTDIGAAFDLLTLRPFQEFQRFSPTPAQPGVNGTSTFNVHSIAIQIPKSMLTSDGSDPSSPLDPRAVIGVYAAASRRKATIRGDDGEKATVGPYVQVSRLGNPLVNEVLIPLGAKNLWNASDPSDDSQFANYIAFPEVQGVVSFVYPVVFPNLAAYTKPRADLVSILLTGIPAGVFSPHFTNYTGPTQADLLRLNIAIPPNTTNPSAFGILSGDAAGFPNGRRVIDDVSSIELRALAGVALPLVDPSYVPDAAAGSLFSVTPTPPRWAYSRTPSPISVCRSTDTIRREKRRTAGMRARLQTRDHTEKLRKESGTPLSTPYRSPVKCQIESQQSSFKGKMLSWPPPLGAASILAALNRGDRLETLGEPPTSGRYTGNRRRYA